MATWMNFCEIPTAKCSLKQSYCINRLVWNTDRDMRQCIELISQSIHCATLSASKKNRTLLIVITQNGYISFIEICHKSTFSVQEQSNKHTSSEVYCDSWTNEFINFIYHANQFGRFFGCWISDELRCRKLYTINWWIFNSCASTAKPSNWAFIQLSGQRSEYSALMILIICHKCVSIYYL